MLGIYELAGGTLRVCLDPDGQQRPKDFKAGAGSGLTLWVCKPARPAAAGQVDILGAYESQKVAEDGSTFTTQVTIERRGNAYQLTYRSGPAVIFVGIGLREGDRLSMSWSSQELVGISVYQIEKGPKLVGRFTQLGGIGFVGRETLTRKEF
jgi:hypothetical protein